MTEPLDVGSNPAGTNGLGSECHRPEEFVESHFPDEEKWQLLDAPIPLEEFERRVFKTSAFFAKGLRLIRPRHFHIVAVICFCEMNSGWKLAAASGESRATTVLLTFDIKQLEGDV